VKKKVLFPLLAVIPLAVAGVLIFGGSDDADTEKLPAVKVVKATITDKALAVGTVEPENEISVKSKISGVVRRIFADAGSHVRAGDPLLEVKPDPTPLELADAKRQVQLKEVEIENLSR
jgi:HlyD family secretion protein